MISEVKRNHKPPKPKPLRSLLRKYLKRLLKGLLKATKQQLRALEKTRTKTAKPLINQVKKPTALAL